MRNKELLNRVTHFTYDQTTRGMQLPDLFPSPLKIKEMGYKQTSEVFQISFVCFNLITGICYKFQLFLLLPDGKLFGPKQLSLMNNFFKITVGI